MYLILMAEIVGHLKKGLPIPSRLKKIFVGVSSHSHRSRKLNPTGTCPGIKRHVTTRRLPVTHVLHAWAYCMHAGSRVDQLSGIMYNVTSKRGVQSAPDIASIWMASLEITRCLYNNAGHFQTTSLLGVHCCAVFKVHVTTMYRPL